MSTRLSPGRRTLAAVDPSVAALWDTFLTFRCTCHRAMLIGAYGHLVQAAAITYWRTTSTQVNLDEFVSYGNVGLVRAVDRFNPEKKATFEIYAIQLIRGAIFDELRSLDWAPRSLRRRQRDMERGESVLRGTLGRAPTLGEIATVVNAERMRRWELARLVQQGKGKPEPPKPPEETADTLQELLREGVRSVPLSLDEPDRRDRDRNRYHVMPAPAQAFPEVDASQSLVWDEAVRFLSSLDFQSQLVLALYYFEGKTLAATARTLGLKESEVSRVHRTAIARLREVLVAALLDNGPDDGLPPQEDEGPDDGRPTRGQIAVVRRLMGPRTDAKVLDLSSAAG